MQVPVRADNHVLVIICRSTPLANRPSPLRGTRIELPILMIGSSPFALT